MSWKPNWKKSGKTYGYQRWALVSQMTWCVCPPALSLGLGHAVLREHPGRKQAFYLAGGR
jgi:hypothetical protein